MKRFKNYARAKAERERVKRAKNLFARLGFKRLQVEQDLYSGECTLEEAKKRLKEIK